MIVGEEYLNEERKKLLHNLLQMYRDAWYKVQS